MQNVANQGGLTAKRQRGRDLRWPLRTEKEGEREKTTKRMKKKIKKPMRSGSGGDLESKAKGSTSEKYCRGGEKTHRGGGG